MPTQSEIARDWGCGRSWVSRCVNKRGYPTDSLEAAREWRECYASSRASTARHSAGHREDNSSDHNTLIPFVAARKIAWRCCSAILDLVLELPRNVAAECNPADPQLALTVLKSECAYIICKAHEVYAVWSKLAADIYTATDAE